MNTDNSYDQARKILDELHEKRREELIKKQEDSRLQRAMDDAKVELGAMDAPRPGWAPRPAGNLEMLIRKHERKYERNDALNLERLTRESEGYLHKLTELERDGVGKGLSAQELAVKSLPSRGSNQQDRPVSEFNRQAQKNHIDQWRIDLEAEAERKRVARVERECTPDPSRPEIGTRTRTPEQEAIYQKTLDEANKLDEQRKREELARRTTKSDDYGLGD